MICTKTIRDRGMLFTEKRGKKYTVKNSNMYIHVYLSKA